jgi:hypothetical protein
MPPNRAELILALRDEISSGMAKVNASLAQTRQAVEGLGASGEKAAKQQAAAWTSATDQAGKYANQLLAVAGVTLSVAGAAYAAKRAYGAWFSLISGGIATVDDFQKKIVGTSYIMATMSDVPAPDLSKAYDQWKDFHKWLYAESIRVDKQSAASSGEIFTVALEMEKKGAIANTREKMEVVGRLTDLMKGVIPVHVSLHDQARSEIEAMMEGTAKLTAQTAKVLSQIDPEFKKNIANARATRTEWEYLGRILPQINQYTKDLMGTWDAVGASLKSAWDIVQIKAFGDAHKDVVGWATQLGDRLVSNGQLTKEGEVAAKALGTAWGTAKGSVEGVIDYLLNNSGQAAQGVVSIATAVGTIASAALKATVGVAKLIDYLDDLSNSRIGMAIIGMGLGYAKGGVPGAVAGGLAGRAFSGEMGKQEQRGQIREDLGVDSETSFWIQDYRRTQGKLGVQLQAQLGIQETLETVKELNKARLSKEDYNLLYSETSPGAAPPTPNVRLPGDTSGGKGGGAGKALEAAERSLENFVQRMKSETARASGEGMAALDEWYAKSSLELDRITGKVGESLEARRALTDAYNSKRTKIETDFHTLVAKESGNAYAGIEAQATNWLTKYQGIAGAETEIAAIKARKIWELDVKNYTDRLGLEKSFYDQAAGLAVDLTDQIGLRREALNREIDIQRYQLAVQLEQLTVAKKITGEERDRYLANQALLDQQKRFNFEMENNKGLTGWAYNRVKSENQRNTWADAMEGLEGFVNDAWTQGAQGALGKVKVDVIELGKTFALSAALNLGKQGIHKLFTGVAESVLGLAGGPNKPAGTASNPYYVVQVGGKAGAGEAAYQRSVTAAGKTGMTLGGGGLSSGAKGFSFTDQYFKDLEKGESKFNKVFTKNLNNWNKQLKVLTKTGNTYSDLQDEWAKDNREAFNTEYLGQYQENFTGMTTGITEAWGVAQGLMTAAGITGETARLVSMVSYGMQGISIVQQIAKGTILADAYRGAAAAFAWMVELLPPPAGEIAGAVAAAAVFAAISAYGIFGGDTSGIATAHSGGIVAHQGMIITAHNGLAPNEVIVKALRDEWILNPQAAASLRSLGGPETFDHLNSGRLPMLNRRGGSPATASAPPAAPAAPAPRPHLNLYIKLPSGEILREDDIWRMTQKGLNKGKIRIQTR